MQRDGSGGGTPGGGVGDDPGPEWSIEDFDDFAPFDDDVAAGDRDEGQGTLEFGPADSPTSAAMSPPAATEPEPDGEESVPAVDEPAPAAEDEEPAPDEPTPDELAAGEPVPDEPAESVGDEPAVAPATGTWGPPAGNTPVPPATLPRDDGAEAHATEVPEEAPAGASVVPMAAAPAREDGGGDAFDDTVESGFEGGEVAGSAPPDEDAVDVPDFASFTSDEYVQSTTQEFIDLAAEMERYAATEHEPSAISAEMPGLATGIVGLDDVVAASGTDPASIPMAPRSNLGSRVFTGLGLAVIFFASLYDPVLVGLFVLVVLVLSAGEFYSALMRAGHRPLGLFGIAGTIGALAGTWAWGLAAVPVAIAATVTATLLFFGLARERKAPMTGAGLTVLGALWIGGMGAFLFELVNAEDYGWLIVATVVTVAAMDMASYFFGRRAGRHRLAPRVSPKKTVEGLVGGVLVALLVGVAFGLRDPFDLGSGLALGAVVAVAAPFGDLAVSVMKRALGVKDMGTLLPGHGGFLDRIDAMLFVMPLAWIVFSWTGLVA